MAIEQTAPTGKGGAARATGRSAAPTSAMPAERAAVSAQQATQQAASPAAAPAAGKPTGPRLNLRLVSPVTDTAAPLTPAATPLTPAAAGATPPPAGSTQPTVAGSARPATAPRPAILPASVPGAVPQAPPVIAPVAPVAPVAPQPLAAEPPAEKPTARARRPKRRFGLFAGFLLFALLPTALVGFYYFAVASPQYAVETQFAVRGSNPSTLDSLGLGLSALPGASGQDADSYVVQNYIESVQVVKDIRRDQDIDIRKFYARPFIDPLYQIAPDMPWVDFADYWEWRIDAEYNSITGNTTFRVFAFTARDAHAIAEAVVAQAEQVVNELSGELRESLIGTAQEEVARTEARLRDARLAVQLFQNATQVLDPKIAAEQEGGITAQLEGELAELRTRQRALAASVSRESPTMRVIATQIAAVEAQLAEQRRNIGSGTAEAGGNNLAELSGRFIDLSLDAEFAQTAYTAALAALETAQTDARKQQRYLATYIPPEAPSVSRHPKPWLYTFIAFVWFGFVWLAGLFLVRTIREHAV